MGDWMNQLYFISFLAFDRNYNYKNHLFLEVFSNMEVWKCSGCFQTKLKDSFGHMISKQMRFLKKLFLIQKRYRTIFDFYWTANMLLRNIKRNMSFQIFKQGDGTL